MMEEQPRPKSPPGYGADLYGKRRQQAKLQVLEREIGFLQEELKSLESIQPTSRCCKEINEFLATKPDPLIAVNQNSQESHCCWSRVSCCSQSDDARHQQVKTKRCCCCCSRENCCMKCCNTQVCSCFCHNCNCCSFKLSCSRNCFSKIKLCPSCKPNCCGSCCR